MRLISHDSMDTVEEGVEWCWWSWSAFAILEENYRMESTSSCYHWVLLSRIDLKWIEPSTACVHAICNESITTATGTIRAHTRYTQRTKRPWTLWTIWWRRMQNCNINVFYMVNVYVQGCLFRVFHTDNVILEQKSWMSWSTIRPSWYWITF